MGTSNDPRESWDSLSSALSILEVSFSQDSCYGSDEHSVSSKTSAPAQSSLSTYVATQPPLHPCLKSILKRNSCSNVENEMESGYGSDGIECDYDALSDEEDEDDDLSAFSVWDETSRDVPETYEDHTESFDDSFITFESVGVHFDPNVHYISTPELSEDEADPQTTFHEMMQLARESGRLQVSLDQLDGVDLTASHEDGNNHHEFVRPTTYQTEEFTRDAVDLDRRLFVAYMNGIHGIADSKYKTYLRTQVDNIRLGHDTELMDPDDSVCMYLDLISNYVNGVFRHLVADEEFKELVALHEEDQTARQGVSSATSAPNNHHALLRKIERLLLERLANGSVDVCPDELSFFAGGIIHALEFWNAPEPI